jgi:hypothetical protein
MRPSEKFEAKAAGQKCSPEVVFSTLRTFLADNAGIGLPLGIERVIGIGSLVEGRLLRTNICIGLPL